MRKSNVQLPRAILAGGLMTISLMLTACQTTAPKTRMPTKPAVTVETNPNSKGGFCADRRDGAALMIYIQELERAAQGE